MNGVRVLNYIDLSVPDGQLRLDIERIIDEGRVEGRASCFMASDILRRIAAESAEAPR